MKIKLFIALWQRPEITRICFKGVKRLTKYFDIEPICVYSDDDNKKLCEEFGFEGYYFKNNPLGAKLNFIVEKALESEWEYLMQIGSDDLLSNKLFDVYKPYMERKEKCFGIGEAYFYDIKTGSVAFVENTYPLGCGRMIHRSVFDLGNYYKVRFKCSLSGSGKSYGKGAVEVLSHEKVRSFGSLVEIMGVEKGRFRLYSDYKNKVLDHDSNLRMLKVGVQPIVVKVNKEPLMLDIKSDTNIWGFEHFDSIKKDILKHFPERNEIRKLRQTHSN